MGFYDSTFKEASITLCKCLTGPNWGPRQVAERGRRNRPKTSLHRGFSFGGRPNGDPQL